MVDYMVRFLTSEAMAQRFGARPRPACMECKDDPEVLYSYSPGVGCTVHAPYCFDCAVSLGIIERASDFVRQNPEEAFRMRLKRNTDLTHFSEGTWWVGR